MAATQKPQHILGTTAMLCSQGGLGKGGVPSLETTPPTHHKRSTVIHSHEDREKVAKQWWDIYHWNWENRGAVQTVRGFLTFPTIAFYLEFLQGGSWLLRWEPRVINKALAQNLLTFSFFCFIPASPLFHPSPSIISTLPKSPLPYSPSLPLPTVWPKLRLNLDQNHRHLRKINPIVSGVSQRRTLTPDYIYPPLRHSKSVLHLYTLLYLSVSVLCGPLWLLDMPFLCLTGFAYAGLGGPKNKNSISMSAAQQGGVVVTRLLLWHQEEKPNLTPIV